MKRFDIKLPSFSHDALSVWLRQHRSAVRAALEHLRSAPLGTLLTVLSIAIALALPTALFLTIDSIGQALGDRQGRQISAFMKLSVDGRELHALAAELEKDPDIASVDAITREQSLARFQERSGMAELLSLLPKNPLPAVLVIHPRPDIDDMGALERLAARIEARQAVDRVLLDREWIGTLFAALHSFERFALTMMLLFSVLVALVIHNGLRIDVLRHQREIEVIKLVGGSDHYIQRPFHYHAVLLGAAGGLLATLLIAIVFLFLQPRFDELGATYGVELPLQIGAGYGFTLILLAVILSLLSARISLGHLLKKIQP